MSGTGLSLPHLGPQARGLLDRIVGGGQQGVLRDQVAEWVLARLLELGYVEAHPLDSAAVVHTPAGLHRWHIEVLAEERRAGERLRKQLIRQRLEARSSGHALVPASRTVPQISDPRMRGGPMARQFPAISGPVARQLPAITGPVVQALPAIAGPSAPSTALGRIGARRSRAYTLAAALGAATSLAALLLSSLGPSDPFSLFQHPSQDATVAPDGGRSPQRVEQAALVAHPAVITQPAGVLHRVAEHAELAPARDVSLRALPEPTAATASGSANADAAHVPPPLAMRPAPAEEAPEPASAIRPAASPIRPVVQAAQAASTPAPHRAVLPPIAEQAARATAAPNLAESPSRSPLVPIAQPTSAPAPHQAEHTAPAEKAAETAAATQVAASPTPPPLVEVAQAEPTPGLAQDADPAPVAARIAAPARQPVEVAKPASPQTASAPAEQPVGLVQARDPVPAETPVTASIAADPEQADPITAAALSDPPSPAPATHLAPQMMVSDPPASQTSRAEPPAAEPAGKSVQPSALSVAVADRPSVEPVRHADNYASDQPAVTHPGPHEVAEVRAVAHRRRVARAERESAGRRPLSGHAEVERLNEQSLAAARKGKEFHPARSMQAAAPVHHVEAM